MQYRNSLFLYLIQYVFGAISLLGLLKIVIELKWRIFKDLACVHKVMRAGYLLYFTFAGLGKLAIV